MDIIETGITGLIEIIPDIYRDERGWFQEFFKDNFLKPYGVPYDFVQDNRSFSKKGVIRGLHFQKEPYQQAKLVTVVTGKVLDVVVDLRKDSKTFGAIHYCILDSVKLNMLMVPEGFAHGIAALEDSILFYKCSNTFNKSAEGGVVWNDPDLQIDWQIENPVISEKDLALPTMQELLRNSVISR